MPAVSVTFAVDRVTGFPWIKVNRDFVSLLPLTKIQVEQYVWSGQAARDHAALAGLDPLSLGNLAREEASRLHAKLLALLDPQAIVASCNQHASTRYEFADAEWSRLRRCPLPKMVDAEAVLASNLTFSVHEHNFGANGLVPQLWTPPDRILRWLGGLDGKSARLPSRQEYAGLRHDPSVRDLIAGWLLNAALRARPLAKFLSTGAVRTLETLCEMPRFGKRTPHGLPFRSEGIWELTSDLERRTVYAGKNPGPTYRPMAVGRSAFLPVLEDNPQGHLILIEQHPVIGFRPVLPEDAVGGVYPCWIDTETGTANDHHGAIGPGSDYEGGEMSRGPDGIQDRDALNAVAVGLITKRNTEEGGEE
jgi:hypothetical protein